MVVAFHKFINNFHQGHTITLLYLNGKQYNPCYDLSHCQSLHEMESCIVFLEQSATPSVPLSNETALYGRELICLIYRVWWP